jgi:hypothetical protein
VSTSESSKVKEGDLSDLVYDGIGVANTMCLRVIYKCCRFNVGIIEDPFASFLFGLWIQKYA